MVIAAPVNEPLIDTESAGVLHIAKHFFFTTAALVDTTESILFACPVK